jgi:hypothetical protein
MALGCLCRPTSLEGRPIFNLTFFRTFDTFQRCQCSLSDLILTSTSKEIHSLASGRRYMMNFMNNEYPSEDTWICLPRSTVVTLSCRKLFMLSYHGLDPPACDSSGLIPKSWLLQMFDSSSLTGDRSLPDLYILKHRAGTPNPSSRDSKHALGSEATVIDISYRPIIYSTV